MDITDIPQADSIHELARFWDTHDLTDFEDQLEEVSEPVFDRDASGRANGAGTVRQMRLGSNAHRTPEGDSQ